MFQEEEMISSLAKWICEKSMVSVELQWVPMIGTQNKSGEEKKNGSRVRKKPVYENSCVTS